jgi:hypothetical protein
MSWINPPATVIQLRNQLMACPTLSTPSTPWNLLSSQYHYPDFTPSVVPKDADQGVTADLLPAILLTLQDQDRDRYAEGAQLLFSGRMIAMLYGDVVSTPDPGYLESLGDALVLDMGLQYFGLCIQSMRRGMCTDLSRGQQAAGQDTPQAAYRMLRIEFDVGLKRGRT